MRNEEVIKELELMRKFNYTLAPMEVFDLAIKALENKCHYDGDCIHCSHCYDCEYRDYEV